MKISFLSCLGLCLLGFTSQAQWVSQPIAFTLDSAPIQIDAVDANTAWTLATSVASSVYQQPQVGRTINAGQTWTVYNPPVLTATSEEATGFSAFDVTKAWVVTVNSGGAGGRILNTTDGGASWTVQSNANVYGSADSYPEFIHFFTATDGVTVGDSPSAGTPLEMYTTANGGTTWTPLTNSPSALANEYPVVTTPATVGNHIWFATTEGRVFHSPDKGLTWTVATIAAGVTEPSAIRFRDAQNGLVVVPDANGGPNRLYRTADGGATWTAVAFTGPLHAFGLSAVPGTSQYVSVGADIISGDAGSSYSRDNGQTWVSLETTLNHFAVEFLSPTVGWSAGYLETPTQITSRAYRFNSSVLSTRTDAALQAGLRVWPNPAVGGRFTLEAARATGSPATVRVLDVAGRQLSQQAWAGTAPLALDLSAEPAGMYVLEIQGASGTARQKVVVQ